MGTKTRSLFLGKATFFTTHLFLLLILFWTFQSIQLLRHSLKISTIGKKLLFIHAIILYLEALIESIVKLNLFFRSLPKRSYDKWNWLKTNNKLLGIIISFSWKIYIKNERADSFLSILYATLLHLLPWNWYFFLSCLETSYLLIYKAFYKRINARFLTIYFWWLLKYYFHLSWWILLINFLNIVYY